MGIELLGGLAASPDPGMPRPLARFADKPFPGRDLPLHRLSRCWSNVSCSAPRVAVVMGKADTGKTHLIARFAREVHAGGAAVLYGRCAPTPAASYQPIMEALDPWVEAGGLELREEAQPHLRELGALIPPTDRTTLVFHALVALLDRIAAQRPLLLVIDDAQWADEDTILRIRDLVRSLDPERTTVVFGVDQDASSADPHSLLRELHREAELDLIRLPVTDPHERPGNTHPKEAIMEPSKKRITLPRAVVAAGCIAAIAAPAGASAMSIPPEPVWQAPHHSAPAPYVSDGFASGLNQVAPSDTSGARLDHRGLNTSKPAAPSSPVSTTSITREVRTITDDDSTLAIVLASTAIGLALCGIGYAAVHATRIRSRIARSNS